MVPQKNTSSLNKYKLYSLKVLLTGRLQVCGITRETGRTVANGVPGVVTGLPWKRGPEGVEEVVEGPAHEHVVVGGQHEGDDHCGQAHTWGGGAKDSQSDTSLLWR